MEVVKINRLQLLYVCTIFFAIGLLFGLALSHGQYFSLDTILSSNMWIGLVLISVLIAVIFIVKLFKSK